MSGAIPWIDTILQGVMLGGLYALFATGLALVFGVMRLVNLAHGDLIVLAAYLVLLLATSLGLPPLVAFVPVVIAMAALGYALQRGLFNYAMRGRDAVLRPLLVTFGLSIVLQNAMLEGFSADSRHIMAGDLNIVSITLAPGLIMGILPLITLGLAVIVLGLLQWMLYRTRLGHRFRATSDDPEIVSAMGVNPAAIFGVASAIAFAVIALAGLMLGLRTSFDPSAGSSTLLFAFEAIIIGGLGDLWGTLIGGILLGVAQNIAGGIDPDWQILAGHLCFLILLIVKPRGLFPRVEHR